MSAPLLRRLQKFRRQKRLTIHELTEQIGAHYTTYHHWKKANKIVGPYKKIVEEFLERNESRSQTSRSMQSDIAVIGVACNYPGAHNLKELWENILARRVQFRRILDQRLPLKDYYDEDPRFPDKIYLAKAAFIDGFDFNWSKLRIPKKTFESTDIVHWLALDTALKTFEDAGYQFKDIPFYQFHNIPAQKTGVILGNTLTGEQTRSMTLRLRWPYVRKTLNATLENFGIASEERTRLSEAMEKAYKSAFFPITEDTLAGGLANTIAGRICNYLNLKGGGYIVDGACSSSLLAVATAANALRLGEMDLVLAGGVDVSMDPFELVGFSKAGALAKDQMRVYDQRASGFVPGEGCGFVLLKRLEDAIKDKDYIYAVIKGWGISSDGKGGIMEPSSGGQAAAIQRAYDLAGYPVSKVDFIEGHGTGTTKGDKVELGGIATALRQATKKMSQRICGVTSFKSIVGHTKAAAGIGGFIKAALAVNQRILPPTANCQEPNEIFADEAKQLYPLIHGKIYPSDKTMRAGISSAGFGGINCHITIESKAEPTKKVKPEIKEQALFASNQNTEVFVFASKTLSLLKKIIQKFKEDLRNISMAEMADLSARLNKKLRVRDPIKVAIVTDSPEHLYEALGAIEHELNTRALEDGQMVEIKSKDPITYIIIGNHVQKNRIGFLYSGQGAQRLNMTRTLVDRFDWAKDLLNTTKAALGNYIYKSEDEALTKEEREKFQKKLSQTEITQPAISFSSLAWTEFLSKMGIEPEVVGGHSLGELAAFYKAGAFDRKTLLKFSEFRGTQMSGRRKSAGMVSLFCDDKKAKSILSQVGVDVVISNMNSPNQTVVSGGLKDNEKVIALAKKEGISTHVLPVSNAFHSSFMNNASKKIASTRLLNGVFKPTKIGLFSCVKGEQLKNEVNLREYFAEQVLAPVNFIKLIESMSEKCDWLIEVGPGRILTDLVKAINKNKEPHCFPIEGSPQNDRDMNIVLAQAFVRNVKLNWQELYRNRTIKPFVPASRRKFIENQCERPIKGVEQTEMLFSKLIAPAHSETIEQGSPPHGIFVPVHAVGSDESVAKILLELTQRMTGFDMQSLNLNLRLLDDLNLDSIKATELIAEAGKVLGLAGRIDPSQYSNKTLVQIRDRFVELKGNASQGVSMAGTEADILRRYLKKTWVRDFVVKFHNEEIEQKDPTIVKGLNKFEILHEDSSQEMVEELRKVLKDRKIDIQVKRYDELKKGKGSSSDCLICLLPLCSEQGTFNEDSLKRVITRLHSAMVTATSDGDVKQRTVVFAQFGGGDFGENTRINSIESGCVRSFASTLHLERPDLRMRILDFSNQISSAIVAQKIKDELQASSLFSIAGYGKDSKRQVPVFEAAQPNTYKKRDIKWSPQDVVLVTGGAKGITAECAIAFARKTKTKMILVGRSPLPSKKTDKDNEINRTLQRFKDEKLQCQYYPCDVTNLDNVKGLVNDIEKEHGKITGFIHGAGLNTLKRLKQSNIDESYQEALPKVMGAVNICKILENNSLKLIAGITSVIGVTGMEGSGWYGLANEILNLFLSQFKQKYSKTEVATVAYSVWDDIGMGTKLGSLDWLSQKGISSIPVAEGVKRFVQLIEGDSGHQQTIVVARIHGLDTWRTPQAKYKKGLRFIEDIKYHMPDVELITRAHLNTKDDYYVLDHNWKGALLLPLVFGLEAMIQAVACLVNIEKYEGITIRDIHLDRPIPVNQESGTTVEIHAQILEQENFTGVKVEIYSDQTGYHDPHFSAIIELGKVDTTSGKIDFQSKANSVLDIVPSTDLYGPVLFQGRMFQCINKLYDLFYDHTKQNGECVLTIDRNKSVDEFFKTSSKFTNFFLGNPFFIDSILQSMQVIITPNIALPSYIEKISLLFVKQRKIQESLVKSTMNKIEDKVFVGNADAYEGDTCFLKIKGCRLKVLEYLSEKPSANDLVNPSQRDQALIENSLNELAQQMGIMVPIARCLYDKRLKGARKEERHKIEIPLIQSTVEELLHNSNKKIKSVKIEWAQSGQPILQGKELENVRISLSHCDSLLICVAGYDEQGCDVENVIKRSEQDWMALLGREKHTLQRKLIDLGFDLNFSGTVVWSAFEAFKKLLNKSNVDFAISDYYKNRIIFKNGKDDSRIGICTMPIETTHGPAKIFSCTVVKNLEEMGRKADVDTKTLRKIGFNEDQLFQVNLDYSGPQKQLVLTQRFPVTFKQNQMLSRRVYFTNYFDWIGTIREYSIYPTFKEFARLAETGEWGMVTNMTELKILGGVKSNDIVEAKIWGEHLEGPKEATTPMFYEWYRITDGGRRERVAVARQKSTWVNVKEDHSVKIEKMPKFLHEYLTLMNPITKESFPRETCPEPYKNISLGKKIKSYSDDIIHKMKMSEDIFSTTLENANLVGNIYFANYAKWLGAVGDRFFYNLIPNYFTKVDDKKEIICLECNIYYLNDAFPFESIKVEMYLDEIYENGFKLYFEFYRIREGKKETKLAYANQIVAFVNWINEIEPKAIRIPDGVKTYLKSKEMI